MSRLGFFPTYGQGIQFFSFPLDLGYFNICLKTKEVTKKNPKTQVQKQLNEGFPMLTGSANF